MKINIRHHGGNQRRSRMPRRRGWGDERGSLGDSRRHRAWRWGTPRDRSGWESRFVVRPDLERKEKKSELIR